MLVLFLSAFSSVLEYSVQYAARTLQAHLAHLAQVKDGLLQDGEAEAAILLDQVALCAVDLIQNHAAAQVVTQDYAMSATEQVMG